MAERREQEKPLAPATPAIVFVEKLTPFPAAEFISRRRKRCLKCCGCSAALLLVIAVTTLALMLTVFHVKDPAIKLNSVNIHGFDKLSNNTNALAGFNLTLVAGISIKNPNAASFKFDEATAGVHYGGALVGEARAPAGEAGPRRKRRMDVVVDIMVDRLVGVSRFESDYAAGILPLSAYARVKGVVKITDVIKRSFVVKINCSFSVDFRSQVIRDRSCMRDLSL
ncbi:late embryogenesis abundant protein At1g64065-like [Salvia miltiorrhiza]|uniref:late embryogenesis abundant protein At1g64065-like n=1 Tax=Salvia miltiorrhiza TaxID=226208 RepID=UPI0025AD1637|nr:late embryogenesis abundant protein At1g64065-like [Salvia miltiorrhiza]